MDAKNQPAITGAIEMDTNLQAAQTHAQNLNATLGKTRRILHADELARMVSPRARLEQAFEKLNAYLYSIDGILDKQKIEGALFAGECMLVFAVSERRSQEQANEGLRYTIKLLAEEFETRGSRELAEIEAEESPVKQGLGIDVGGRKMREGRPVTEVYPKLNAIMEHIFTGKPYKF